jgi:hypothetical protein
MNQFPLYTSLSIDIQKKDLTIVEKKEFIKNIKKLDQNGHDLIYALIRIFYLDKEDNISGFTLPYGGKFIKNDLRYDLESLPCKLKQLINKFIFMHIKKMSEENKNKFI